MSALWALAAAACLAGLACLAVAMHKARRANAALWLPAYLRGDWAGRRGRRASEEPVHVMFCLADHFEPALGDAPPADQLRRVRRWTERYSQLVDPFRDADGRAPRHTVFYPAEQYREENLEALAPLVRAGLAEVEVHLHHDGDTADGLRRSLQRFVARLRSHGYLGEHEDGGGPRFGFVHGNWALDNSRPDGRWCGVNDELAVLRECGCYADFTLPSAPSPTQTRRINSIYYATDDPGRPKSHDDGEQVQVGGAPEGDLMIIQGPLCVRWPGGKLGVLPRLENGNLAGGAPPTPRRVRAWLRTRVCVAGRPDWVFIKVHTHGCDETNWPVLLGEPMRRMHRSLARLCQREVGRRLHYVTAREMYNIVRAAERGLTGDPDRYRDLEILPPPAAGTHEAPRPREAGAQR